MLYIPKVPDNGCTRRNVISMLQHTVYAFGGVVFIFFDFIDELWLDTHV